MEGLWGSSLGSPSSLTSIGLVAFFGWKASPVLRVLNGDADKLLRLVNGGFAQSEKSKNNASSWIGRSVSKIFGR